MRCLLARIPVLALAVLLPHVDTVRAQPLGTDLLVCDHVGTVFRITPSGQFFTIGSYGMPGRFMWDLTPDALDQNVIASFAASRLWTGELLSIDVTSGAATTLVTGIGAAKCVLDENGDFIVSGWRDVVHVNRAGTATTLYTASAATPLVDRDVSTGNWLIGVGTDLLHYDPSAATVRTINANPVGMFAMVADPTTTDAYSADFRIYRHDTTSGMTTMLPPLLGQNTVGDRAIVLDRAPGSAGELLYVNRLVGAQHRIQRVDRNGVVISSVGSFPNEITGIVFDRSRNLGPQLVTPPNDRVVHVGFANAVGRPFVVAFSLSGTTPGLRLPDGRRVALNADALTAATLVGPLSPWLSNNTGILDARGRASVTLRLNGFGNSIRGVRLWAVAIAFDPAAPLGISQISTPVVFVL